MRRWHHDEAAALGAAVHANLDHLRPWMPWIAFEPMTLDERVQLIEGWTIEWEVGNDCTYGVFLEGEIVGSTGLHQRGAPGTLDIGYWVHADYVRRGLASEIATALTTAAFGLDEIDAVRICVDEANVASLGVPTKVGFQHTETVEREPEAPAESGRLTVWTMTREQWSASNSLQASPNPSRNASTLGG